MAATSTRLNSVKKRFDRVCEEQKRFVIGLPMIVSMKGKRAVPISKTQRFKLCGMAFVVLFTAWEEFLESAFEALIVDARLADFKRRNMVLAVNADTVSALLRGSRRYSDWANHDAVRERAKVFFKQGEPFESALSSAANDLKNMRVIRNYCVHSSKHAAEQYRKMIRRVYGVKKAIVPGSLLLGSPPSGLSTAAGVATVGSVFELYGTIMSTLSSQIIVKAPK